MQVQNACLTPGVLHFSTHNKMTSFVRVHGPLVDKHTYLESPTLISLASGELAFA
jgi:hypothetical protein